jgi:hypothetical protein
MFNPNFKISTHNSKHEYSGAHFFILNKGLNCGKPLEKPCPNCFVCECENEEDKKQLFWLFYGLWQGKIFHPYLTGLVILFIHLRHVKDIILDAINKMNISPEKFKSHINKVHQLEQNTQNILKQLELMKQLKRVLMLELIS